jgi:hypothetical protein
VSGGIDLSVTTFGAADCTRTTATEVLTWNVSAGSTAIPTSAVFRVFANNVAFTAGTCTATTGPAAPQLGLDLQVDQTTPVSTGTTSVSPKSLIDAAVLNACNKDGTIYLCVALIDSTTTIGVAQSNALTLQVEPPPVPVNVVVDRGDTRLHISWSAGTDNGVAATSYQITVTAVDPTGEAAHHKTVVGATSGVVDGLTNGTKYAVQVASVSGGGNVSALSSDVATAPTATPEKVLDFWDQYTQAGGVEKGGCAGGAAGALSLLGLAGLVRALRRRS